MTTLDNLPKLIAESPQAREDLLSTLVGFCHRYGIDATPEDFVGLSPGAEEDTRGQALATGTGRLQGLPPVVASPQVLIYRDGPHYSRWIWTG